MADGIEGVGADEALRREVGSTASSDGRTADTQAAAATELVGTPRADSLIGGDGDDRIIGGLGVDRLTGGKGADVFVFRTVAESRLGRADVITDFTVGEDTLDLSAIDADTTTPGDQGFTFIGTNRFSDRAGEVRVTFEDGVLTVAADIDGDGRAEFHLRIDGLPTVSEADFVV